MVHFHNLWNVSRYRMSDGTCFVIAPIGLKSSSWDLYPIMRRLCPPTAAMFDRALG